MEFRTLFLVCVSKSSDPSSPRLLRALRRGCGSDMIEDCACARVVRADNQSDVTSSDRMCKGLIGAMYQLASNFSKFGSTFIQGCMERPLLLDLFCCAGGAARGYYEAGFDVVGIDNKVQPNYPYEFIQGDAIQVGKRLLATRTVGAIHASPPCQKFSAYRRRGQGVGSGYLNLIPVTRELCRESGLPYVIENVPGAPLENPVQYCGSSFALDIRRHRLFESNVALTAPECDHSWQKPRFPPATNRKNLRCTMEIGVWRIPLPDQQRAMGIDNVSLRELSQAVPPAYTKHIGAQLLVHIKSKSQR